MDSTVSDIKILMDADIYRAVTRSAGSRNDRHPLKS